MALPKIKLCWNGSRFAADWHLGLFGTYARGGGTSRLRGVVISVRGVFVWLGALAFVAYFTGAAALWWWLGRRPHNLVTYADLVLPTRWDGIRAKRGQALIAEAKDDLAARKWGDGIQKLRIGIAKYPEERDSRLVLAEIFLAMKARKLAISTYDGGLDHGYPGRAYMEAMLKSAAQSENHEWAIRTCDRALAMTGKDAEADRAWLIQRKTLSLLAAGRVDEALGLADEVSAARNSTLGELRVLGLLQAGRPAEAVAFLRAWIKRTGAVDDPQILRLEVRALRESGDLAGMESTIERLRRLTPADPRPYAYAIVQRALAGIDAGAGIESYLMRFGSQPEALQLLANPLAEIGRGDLLDRLLAHARQQGFNPAPIDRLRLQVLMGKGEWRLAEGVLATLKPGTEGDPEETWRQLAAARIQAALDPAEGAQSNLVALVRGRLLALGFYKDLIVSLRQAGRPATAREIVTFAQGLYPENQQIDGWRKELDAELAASEAARQAAIPKVQTAVSVPALAIPAVVREKLTEAAFDERLAGLEKAGDFEGALALVREARRSKPDWLAARDTDLARREVGFYGRAGDLLGLRAAARLYVTGDRLRSAQMIETARELRAAGRKAEAVFLLRELAARVPDYAPAARLLAEWEPAPAAK